MISKKIAGVALLGMMIGTTSFAGNEDRAGSAGSQQLLINPWARSSAWADAGVSSVTGLEAMYMNVAGLAFTDQTEIMFSRTNWLQSSGVSINNIGLAQRIGETTVLGLSVMAMNYGDIPITTVENPEGNIGTFRPQSMNFAFSYSKEFSNSIYGGLTVRALSESIANVKAGGVSFDAGIRYVTGERDQMKFGITLRNVGPPMSYKGDGLSYTINQDFLGIDLPYSVEQRSASFELPSMVNIGVSYDFLLGEDHSLTAAGTFTSNSFTKDQIRLGAEYHFKTGKANFAARAGYTYENGILQDAERTTALTGPAAGLSLEFGVGQGGTTMALDYSYRVTNPFVGVHCMGVRINVN